MQGSAAGNMIATRSNFDSSTDLQYTFQNQSLFIDRMAVGGQTGARLQAQQIRTNAIAYMQHLGLDPAAKGPPLALVRINRQMRNISIGNPIQQPPLDPPGLIGGGLGQAFDRLQLGFRVIHNAIYAADCIPDANRLECI